MSANQQQLIVKLSKKYGFDSKEALEYIKRGTPLLPFDGKNRKECCQALSKQCGLFLQCTGIPDENDKEYCKKCEKSNAATTNGTIETRLVLGEKDFKEKKGDILKSYEQYIKQKKWTVEEIIQEAQQQGRTLEVQDSWISDSLPQKRGRHPKPQEEKEVKEEKEEKKRQGRPKKTQPIVVVPPSLSLTEQEETTLAQTLEHLEEAEVLQQHKETLDDEEAQNHKKVLNQNAIFALENPDESDLWGDDSMEELMAPAPTPIAPKSKGKVAKEPKEKVAKEPKEKVAKEPKEKVAKEPKEKVAKETEVAKEVNDKKTKGVEEEEELEEEEEEEEILQVETFEHEGIEYFRNKHGLEIYDKNTQTEIGYWDEETQSIVYLELE